MKSLSAENIGFYQLYFPIFDRTGITPYTDVISP
jgi:hypothetical protein